MTGKIYVSAVVEGILDEAVVDKLIRHAGGNPDTIYGKQGKDRIRRQIVGYNHAALRSPWFVLVDLDQEKECAPALRDAWVQDPAPNLCFRVAVRAVEAWLLADFENLARFLRVPPTSVPKAPENLENPKRALVDLASRSRSRGIKEEMVPRLKSGRLVGPAYTSRMVRFVQEAWNPVQAAPRAPSLRRAMDCLAKLMKRS